MIIRKASPADRESVWNIFSEHSNTPNLPVADQELKKESTLSRWFDQSAITFVAEIDGEIAGSLMLNSEQEEFGSHVAYASYLVSPRYYGSGIGRKMGVFSINVARDIGFLSIQFNLIPNGNKDAIPLWNELGFEVKGSIPVHSSGGSKQAYVMSRRL